MWMPRVVICVLYWRAPHPEALRPTAGLKPPRRPVTLPVFRRRAGFLRRCASGTQGRPDPKALFTDVLGYPADPRAERRSGAVGLDVLEGFCPFLHDDIGGGHGRFHEIDDELVRELGHADGAGT